MESYSTIFQIVYDREQGLSRMTYLTLEEIQKKNKFYV
jgi:hypothetical protein